MTGPNRSRTDSVTKKTRQEEALGHCLKGLSMRKIAIKMGVSKSAAHNYVKLALEECAQRRKDLADKIVDLELDRLDKMLVGLWPAASDGDVKAVDAVIKIMQRRARYLALDSQASIGDITLNIAETVKAAREEAERRREALADGDKCPAKE